MPERQFAESLENKVPVLSVVVCTYNRTKLLPASLSGLMLQTIRDQIQVIVIDDGSTQDTASVVGEYDVDFVALGTNQGLSAARNAGIARARAPIVAFTDDDVIVPPDWCESLMAAWNGAPRNTCAIGGTVTVAEVTSLTQRYLTRHNPLSPIELDVAHAETFLDRLRAYLKSESAQNQSIRPVYSLVGANMSFTREALSEVGGFDPSIRFGGDEELVCVNLRRKFGDQSILCYSSIVVAHSFDPRLRDTLRRAFLYGFSNGRTWARNGGIPGLRPVGGLFMVSLMLTAPISIIGAVLASLLIPFTMWRRWVRASFSERNPEVIVYPLIALAQELCSNIGFFVGWQKEHRRSN
jgi:glycosyltransferase involved in cell wall biosynthesis